MEKSHFQWTNFWGAGHPDDGLNPSGEPPHVARRQFAAGTYGLLHRHDRLGISHYASMLVGWCSVAEIVSCGQGAIRRCAERRRDCTDDEPADVVCGIASPCQPVVKSQLALAESADFDRIVFA